MFITSGHLISESGHLVHSNMGTSVNWETEVYSCVVWEKKSEEQEIQ